MNERCCKCTNNVNGCIYYGDFSGDASECIYFDLDVSGLDEVYEHIGYDMCLEEE